MIISKNKNVRFFKMFYIQTILVIFALEWAQYRVKPRPKYRSQSHESLVREEIFATINIIVCEFAMLFEDITTTFILNQPLDSSSTRIRQKSFSQNEETIGLVRSSSKPFIQSSQGCKIGLTWTD